ncbi:DNA cytosine methyltransferase [Nitrosovibrio sp. Nv4]|uniref:DNA cytosine methyltransferase n=1 Tax=Nitrosovibrio sp. Nv4 TaxID=1945880 RepID=UPI000BE3AAB7
MNELALFAGAGGGILGGKLLGWRTVCAVERDAYAAQVLAQRQNDGILAPFPIWSDVESFDGKPWRGIVDVVSGGFPCQDISVAGKGAGITGERSGLWSEMARIIGEVRPRFAFIENSPALVNRGLDRVLADLAAMGFDAEWGVLSAADVGAPHLRERIWIVANANGGRCARQGERQMEQQGRAEAERASKALSHNLCQGLPLSGEKQDGKNGWQAGRSAATSDRWPAEPNVGRVVHGVAHRMDRIRSLGNGQVPLCAATAFRLLAERAGIE